MISHQNKKYKLVRISTVPSSLKVLLRDQLKFMNESFEVIAISSEGKDFDEVIETQGVRGYKVDMTRRITPFRDLAGLLRLYLIFRKERPEIVHTHTPKAGILGMFAAWMAMVPYRFHTVAGLPLVETKGIKKVLLLFIERLTYFFAIKVYANSFEMQKIILDYKLCYRKKISVIGFGSTNGINLDYFNPQIYTQKKIDEFRKEMKVNNKFVFCFIGRIVKDKGITELFEAFSALYNINQNICLLLIGNYESNSNLSDDFIEKLNTHPGIKNVGYIEDIRLYLLISNVFVFPSYREGFPNVILQACAMNLPCIVTNINGSNEIIKHDLNGRIVEKKQILPLFVEMRNLSEQPEVVLKYKENCRKSILEKYDQKFVWNEILKEYKSFL